MLKVGPYASALDLPEFKRGGATEALNVIPRADSYGPLPSFKDQGNAMPARVQGAAIARGIAGGIAQFAATATRLFRWDVNGLNWSDVTRISGGDYAVDSHNFVRFTQFGDHVISVNGADATQVFTIASSSNFAALAGSPPVGRHIATARDFVFIGNISGFRNRVQWCGLNNHTTWTQSQATQADQQDLPDGGEVMSLIGGEYLIVIQERNIQRGTYDNLPLIWRFDKIKHGIGTPCENATARYEHRVFFLSEDGFQMLVGGVELQSIGRNRVDLGFWNDIAVNDLHHVTAAVDPINKLAVWSYRSKGATAAHGICDKLLIYNWPDNRWARAEVEMEVIHSAVSQNGFTLDQLDVFGTLDSLPFSLDSSFWVGAGRPLLSGFTTAHKIGFFNGANLAATIDTTEYAPAPGRRFKVRSVRPIIEGAATPTVRIGHRSRTTDAVVLEPAAAMNVHGICPVLVDDRYMRARIEIQAGQDWRHVLGIDDSEGGRTGKR